MRVSRFALTAAAVVLLGLAAQPASAESFQLCLSPDGQSTHQYFLNFAVQGNAILVGGMKGRGGQEDHGPVLGSLARTPSPSYGFEMGLTVTFANGGDYTGPNLENVVFQFNPDGTIAYKRWLDRETSFTQGTAVAITCPL